MPTITRLPTTGDPRVTYYAAVRDPGLVRQRGLFVAEGRLVVERLIASGAYTIHSMLFNDAALTALRSVVDSVDDSVPLYVCSTEEMARFAGVNIHRGCLALVERPPERPIDDLLHGTATLVVLEDVANPDNIGGIFRNVAAFGADGVVLSPGCCDPFYRKAIRTSVGATLRVPFARSSAWPADLLKLRSSGFQIVALTPRQPSESIGEFASRVRPARLALLFGTEGDGLTASAIDTADLRVRIPVAQAVDSLNVAVAAGIVLSRLAPRS